jgi:hypothetical protein
MITLWCSFAKYRTVINADAPGGKYVIYSGIDMHSEYNEDLSNFDKHRRLNDIYDRRADIEQRIEYYPPDREPKPFSPGGYNKVLGLVLAYGFDHVDPFMLLLLPEYVSMCESGWDPTMVIFTAAHWTPLLRRLMVERAYCTRLGRNVKIEWAVYNKTISTFLAAEHRKYIAARLNDYDVFMYHEDDIPFRAAHLNAYIQATHDLKHRLPWTGLYDYTIGFQRFRHIHRQNLHDEWNEQDMVEQCLLEETPSFDTTCIPGEDFQVNPWDTVRGNKASTTSKGPGTKVLPTPTQGGANAKSRRMLRKDKNFVQDRRLVAGDWENKVVYPYISVSGNIHQGAFILTQEQVKILHIKCHFLNHSSPSREYMSSFSLFDRKPWHCGLTKLLPAERMHSFFIHHFYHTKWVSWFTNSMVVDKTMSGQLYLYSGNLSNPACWSKLLEKTKTTLDEQKRLVLKGENWYNAIRPAE